MVYVSVATRVPEELASEFTNFAEENGITTSMALKYLIMDAIKRPDRKMLPFWEMLKDLYQREDTNLVLTYSILERIPFTYQCIATILEDLKDTDHAQKVRNEEEIWRRQIKPLGENIEKILSYDKNMLKEIDAQLRETINIEEEKWGDNK